MTSPAPPTSIPPVLAPRDIFLGAYLPYLAETHFLLLELLLSAQRSSPAAAAAAKPELDGLPLRGPEIVSAVMDLERIVRAAQATPPPPPRAREELAAWRTALLGASRPSCVPAEVDDQTVALSMRANAALHTGRALGDLEQTLRLAVLVDQLAAADPSSAWAPVQRDNLEQALAAGQVHLRDLAGEGTVKLASPLGPAAMEALRGALEKIDGTADPSGRAGALGAVRSAARTVELCMFLPRPRAVLGAIGARTVGWLEVLRPLLQLPDWSFPCVLEGAPPAPVPAFATRDGKKVLQVFTDAEASKVLPAGSTFLTTLAWAALGQLDASVDEVAIDPGSAHEARIEKADLPRLKSLCLSARLERLVRDFSGLDVPALLQSEAYRTFHDDTRVLHAWAPDHQGRPHVAIFTSDDAIAAYSKHTPPPPGAKVGQIAGAKLFPLVREQNPAGIVFDPLGPLPPRWFARSFLERLLR